MYKAERWVPLPVPVDVFRIALETTEDLKNLLGATSVRVAYNRGGTILVEWTMMHRETFAGFVGQYIVRNNNGEFQVLDQEDLMRVYEPFIESTDIPKSDSTNDISSIGKLLASGVDDEGSLEELLFELPDGSPATFVKKLDILPKVDSLPKVDRLPKVESAKQAQSVTKTPANIYNSKKEKNNEQH